VKSREPVWDSTLDLIAELCVESKAHRSIESTRYLKARRDEPPLLAEVTDAGSRSAGDRRAKAPARVVLCIACREGDSYVRGTAGNQRPNTANEDTTERILVLLSSLKRRILACAVEYPELCFR
jgi:hypothetical protein